MNINKAELKIDIAKDIGASIEDSLEAAKKDMYRQEGAIAAFGQAAKSCEMLCKGIDQDLDEGRVPNLETAEALKLWVTRAANAQRNLARSAENSCMSASGKVAALEGAVALIAKYARTEELKIAAVRIENPEKSESVELPGMRPGPSIKERRLAEEQAMLLPIAELAPAEVIILPSVKRRGRPPGKTSRVHG